MAGMEGPCNTGGQKGELKLGAAKHTVFRVDRFGRSTGHAYIAVEDNANWCQYQLN